MRTFASKVARCALAAVLVAGMCPASALAQPQQAPSRLEASAAQPTFQTQEVVSGTYWNLTWTLDYDTGVLDIQGMGSLATLKSSDSSPFHAYRDYIKSAVVNEGVTSVGMCAFRSLPYLESVSIPSSVKSIGWNAFLDCTSLRQVDIPDSVTSIDISAFNGCSSLQSVHMGSGVCRILENAFANCTSLESVDLPNNEECVINARIFVNCPKLLSIMVPAGIRSYSETESVFLGSSIESAVLSDETQHVQPNLFKDTSLKSVVIPESVLSVGASAFEDTALESVTIPSKVEALGEKSFKGCSSLTSMTFKGDAPDFGTNVFGQDTLTAYFPAKNSTWTPDKKRQYGGTVKWRAHGTAQVSFPDVAEDAWYCDSVYDSVGLGLFSGYGDGSFGAGDGLTRAQAAVVLWRYFAPQEVVDYNAAISGNATDMPDIENGMWYTAAANWVVANKVINGKDQPDGTRLFDPHAPLTREQLCTVVANAAANLKGADISSDGAKLAAMPDAASVSGWAAAGVSWGLDKGIISGKQVNGQRLVAPSATVTRAEMAAIMVNAINGEVL